MHHIKSPMIANAISQLSNPFDSHDVERRVLRTEPIAFANELLRYAQSKDILQAFSAQFALFVGSCMQGQIRKTSKVNTPNLGGLDSPCQQWEKLPGTGSGTQTQSNTTQAPQQSPPANNPPTKPTAQNTDTFENQ